MASLRCQSCGSLHFITMTQRRTGTQATVLKGMLDCPCGSRTGFELRQPDFLETEQSALRSFPANVSEAVRRLYLDAESAYFMDAFAASLATARMAIELALRERGLDAADLRALIEQAVDANIMDDNTVVRLGLTGIVRDDRQEFAAPVDPHRALSALQVASVVLSSLGARREAATRPAADSTTA